MKNSRDIMNDVKKMIQVALVLPLYFCFMMYPTFARAMTIGTPGGPAPALKECVTEFSKAKNKMNIEVVAGPVEKWQDQASNFELLFSGSENMMDGFIKKFDFFEPATIETHYLRPAAILVRKGNPLQIKGVQDLISKQLNILVVDGAGQVGMWEDVVGRTQSAQALNSFRKNIKFSAVNTGVAEKKWNEDKSLDAWVVFNIWGSRASNESEIVKIESEYAIFRSMGSVKNKNSKNSKLRDDFLTFLKSNRCHEIFKKHGWQ